MGGGARDVAVSRVGSRDPGSSQGGDQRLGTEPSPGPTCMSLSPAGQSTPALLYESETEDLLMPGGLPE